MNAITVLFLLSVAGRCQGECLKQFAPMFYRANNRSLLNHVFQTVITPSVVMCGRECSMNPHCASFNYRESRDLCEMNDATRGSHDGVCDFVEQDDSVYFDDNYDTSFIPVPLKRTPRSCQMLFEDGHRDNGIYTIYPGGMGDGIRVYCDMQADDGGWVVFQRRRDGSVDFYRNWTEYQSGFGNLCGEFWLGNDILRNLTESTEWELRVELEDWEGNSAWAGYRKFAVVGVNYTLIVGSFNGASTVRDSMYAHNLQMFSTRGRDNDIWDEFNSAEVLTSAWWFKRGLSCHLNGKYYPNGTVDKPLRGLMWLGWKASNYSLKGSVMKIREIP